MITYGKAIYKTAKLQTRIGKIIGEKNVDKFLSKKKGLGKSRQMKIAKYIADKPESALRRIKRINKALDVAPYAGAAGAGALGISFLNRKDEI